ncbi:cell cycle regulator of non-homologous end joining isoform X1 [Apteryx mantelli]|uniref:Cell cycle regulator of non-homologous end joining isoform X1 n=1 Tax=Apteryx mantelli TaxID=2696672 RepID=A0ABM4FSG3_9AVES
MAAGGRRRLLPAWMAAAERPAAPPAPPPAARRRQRQAAAAPRAATVYCMNEAELVDVALGTLAEKLQREEAEEKAWYGSEEEQELPPTLSTPAGSAGSAEEGSDCNPGLPSPLGAGAEKTGGEDSGDDVLKYVREIFFS